MSALTKQPIDSLPDDPHALKKIIAEMAVRITALEGYVRLSKIKKYAASSEKSADQHELFNEAELTVIAEEAIAEDGQQKKDVPPPSATSTKKPGRKPLPKEFPACVSSTTYPNRKNTAPVAVDSVSIDAAKRQNADLSRPAL